MVCEMALAWPPRRGRGVGVFAKEKGEQGQRFILFRSGIERHDGFEVKFDVGFLGGDFVCVVNAPMASIGQKTKAHPQCAQVALQLVVRIVFRVSFAGVEFFVPSLGLANGGNQLVIFVRNECGFLRGVDR